MRTFVVLVTVMILMVYGACDKDAPVDDTFDATYLGDEVWIEFHTNDPYIQICLALREEVGDCPCMSRQGEVFSSCIKFDRSEDGFYLLTSENPTVYRWANHRSCEESICTYMIYMLMSGKDSTLYREQHVIHHFKGTHY